MRQHIRPALVLFAILTLVTGVFYPLAVTGVAQVAFPHLANGSLVEHDGKTVGSSLIGQGFNRPEYFWSRPSAADYNGGASSGSNLGPTNPALFQAVNGRVESIRQAEPSSSGPVPIDLVTTSASGLDPHISPAAADFQVPRVSRARGLSADRVRALIAQHTEGRTFGLLGEPRVNVLLLNLALDREGAQGAAQ